VNEFEKNTLGEIITFYSFKGGAGRTMALANIAVLTSKLSTKVLIIDWDLEAPGLHKFFYKHISPDQYDSSLGLIDMFIAIDEKIASHSGTKNDAINLQSLISEIDPRKYIVQTNLSGVYLMKAGLFDNFYSERITKFNWLKFFEKAPNFFKEISMYFKRTFDYTFIDSRTGFTDTGGICTTLMPDRLCLIFTTNSQSLDGISELTQKALSYRVNSLDFRPLKIYPIPSRVELAEKDLREIWRKGKTDEGIIGFQPLFEGVFKAYYGFSNCDLTSYFDLVQIHHEPKYTYGEEIAVISEKFSDNLSLTKAYSNVLQKVILDNSIYSENIVQNKPNAIRVYISYSQRDASAVRAIMAGLEKDINITIVNSAIGKYANEETISAISNCDVFIPLLTEEYISSEFVSHELNILFTNIVGKSNLVILPLVIGLISSKIPSLFSKMLYKEYSSLKTENIERIISDLVLSIYSNSDLQLALSKYDRKGKIVLNERELEFLKLSATELTDKEIAEKMYVSPRTIDGYREVLFQKLNVQTRVGLVIYAIKNGIIEL
jgi:DNA-binding CsgD family transcriptional regulator